MGSVLALVGNPKIWAIPNTTTSSVDHVSWNGSWPKCSKGPSGRRSAGMGGADSARQRCSMQEHPCLASRRGADGGPHKRPEGMHSARKKEPSNSSPNGLEPQIWSARTCSQRDHPSLRSAMSSQWCCSPTTSSAIATTAMTSRSAAQGPCGAVTPRPDPKDERPG